MSKNMSRGRYLRSPALPWEKHKWTIIHRYRDMDWTLEETMALLLRECKFSATRKQYATKLRQWGIKKQVDWQHDMPIIVKAVEARWRLGKRTEVVSHQTVVRDEKMARYLRQNKIRRLPDSPAGPLPAHIRCSTPDTQPQHDGDPDSWVEHVLRNTYGVDQGMPSPVEEEPQERIAVSLSYDDLRLVRELRRSENRSRGAACPQTSPIQPITSLLSAPSSSTSSPPRLHCPDVYNDDVLKSIRCCVEKNDRPGAIGILYNLRSSILESEAFSDCLLLASKNLDESMFKVLILAALFMDEAGTCPRHLITSAQLALKPLIASLLKNRATQVFGFLFRSGIISAEAARHMILYHGLLNGDVALLKQFLNQHHQLYTILDLDTMMQNATAIRYSMSIHGSTAASMVVHAAHDAGLLSSGGVSAIHLSVSLLLYDETSYFLAHGADINQKLFTGQSPLQLLAEMAECDIMQVATLLVSGGAQLDLRDAIGDNCLHTVLRQPQKQWTRAFAQLLVENGLDINTRNGSGDTALGNFSTQWHSDQVGEVYDWLLNNGAIY
ncbi:hypothetical protein VHEMI08917 [[Torrubiella] hemipterigena]|uniref:Clr5 domain-containing protein n=1 Tax=[Torrubiella] hemipterigena TaxID=1531966 RepID=A0A0A1TPE1_9HYPO|nr:hypothetical protein VHEMI08917 [[Torrubiella] hemipterigena]